MSKATVRYMSKVIPAPVLQSVSGAGGQDDGDEDGQN
jgi:hypothetical protein